MGGMNTRYPLIELRALTKSYLEGTAEHLVLDGADAAGKPSVTFR